jgi:RHS repeat-associated protein
LDRFGRIVDQRWLKSSDGAAVDRLQYTYDRNGNRLSRTNLIDAAFSESYSYDNLNQLTGFTRGSHTRSWDYDAQGNWQSVTTNGNTQTRSHNAQNEITGISGATTPTYDANGNLTRDETGRQFVYDAWNRLVAVKDAGGATLKSYAYDGLHRRIRETASGTSTDFYYSDAWQVLEERIGGQVKAQYVWSPVYVDALVLRDRDTNGDGTLDERLWVVQDANYNVVALFDNSGNVVERYVYDPFGQVTVLDAGWNVLAASAFGWLYLHQGGRFDSVSGLYHFRFRDYSPTLGRWTSLDPLRFDAGDVNLYRTVFNAPTVFTDPSGQIIPLLVIGGVLLAGAGIGGLHYAASRYDYAREHYLSRPIDQWTPEVQAEYRDYVRTTDWILAGSEVTAVTGTSMVATPYMAYGSGYLWTAGGTSGRILVGTAGAGGLSYAGHDGYTIIRDWGVMEGPERFRRVGNLAGPTAVGFRFGPHYFNLGRNAAELRIPFWSSWERVTPPYYGIEVSRINYTARVIDSIDEDRPYVRSILLMQEIMASRRPIPDPGSRGRPGIPGGLRWDAPGLRWRPGWDEPSYGIYELVIDPRTNTVVHYVYVGRRN